MTATASTVIAIVCGKSKRSYPTAVADIYTSLFIREAVAWARSIPDHRLYVISGGLGFIPGDTVVEPYEAQPRTETPWATEGAPVPTVPQIEDERVREQVEAEGVRGEVLVVGGGTYGQILGRAAAGLVTVWRPFYELAAHRYGIGKIGYQRHLFREFHGRIPPRVPLNGGPCEPGAPCCAPPPNAPPALPFNA